MIELMLYVPVQTHQSFQMAFGVAPVLINGGKVQWRSQNAEKVTHIKGRLLDQAVILFNCVPFQNGNYLKGKNLLLEGANSFPYEQFL